MMLSSKLKGQRTNLTQLLGAVGVNGCWCFYCYTKINSPRVTPKEDSLQHGPCDRPGELDRRIHSPVDFTQELHSSFRRQSKCLAAPREGHLSTCREKGGAFSERWRNGQRTGQVPQQTQRFPVHCRPLCSHVGRKSGDHLQTSAHGTGTQVTKDMNCQHRWN
ncbi:hypothetical protein NP493_98g00029 [Ridgeia piscesae]|uniref:Uncharacterized protein n=1 Tax=Ridgeia piscesae TaxID=27915 RepID=A0AAD9P7Q4_RIDPI|nr:hypothetical protein NP493_98g00029 [Ridgeia piscesae]